jgi:4-amino-4-deoxy-L-arabinose transferase-like glycosyltransferase
MVVAYAAVQLVLRLLIGSSLELDEAEAFYHARRLAWGYGPQPPLYFWLQWGLFQLVGEGLLALALLKALTLSATVLGLFALLRKEAGEPTAAVAALALSLLPQVVWEGQRALSHSMLALLMAVVTTGAAVRAFRRGGWGDHLLLGLALGLGLLSKFNFVVWPVGLLAAALLLPEWRAGLKPLRLAAAVLAAALVAAPVAVWMWQNPVLATGSVGKLGIEEGTGAAARIEASGQLLLSLLTFLALPMLVLGGLTVGRRVEGANLTPIARLLAAGTGASVLLLWAGLLASGTTEMRERWLLPFAWGLVPAAVTWLRPRLPDGRRRILTAVTVGLWLLVVPLLPYASLVDPGWRGADFTALAEKLRGVMAGDHLLLVDSQWVAGNLALTAPDLAPQLLVRDEVPSDAVVLSEAPAPSEGTDDRSEVLSIARGREPVVIVLDLPEEH